MNRSPLFLITVVLGSSFAHSARADLTPPEVSACQGKQVGSVCEDGVCSNSTCSKVDYLNWMRDASAAPPTIQYACVKCVANGGDRDASITTRDASTGSPDASTALRDASVINNGDASMVKGDAGSAKKDEDSGCNVAGNTRSMASLALALGFAMLVRRRRT